MGIRGLDLLAEDRLDCDLDVDQGLNLLAEDRLDCDFDGDQRLDLLAEDRLDCDFDGDQGLDLLAEDRLDCDFDGDQGLDLLAEDRLDCDFDGDHGDDLASVHDVGFDDLTLEDRLVLDGDLAGGAERHLDLRRTVHWTQRPLVRRDREHVTDLCGAVVRRLEDKPEVKKV